MRKEYLIDGQAREVLGSIKETLGGIAKSWDVDETTLGALKRYHSEVWMMDSLMPLRLRAPETLRTAVVSCVDVLEPITSLGYLPTGGEQRGNMLCVEQALHNIDKVLAS